MDFEEPWALRAVLWLPLLPGPPRPPLPLLIPGSSFSLVMTTRWSLGCLCSDFEFIMKSAWEVWSFTASIFSRTKGFLNVLITWMLKCVMSPCSSGCSIARCLANAFLSSFFLTSSSCLRVLKNPVLPLSPQYSAEIPSSAHSLHPPLYRAPVLLCSLYHI